MRPAAHPAKRREVAPSAWQVSRWRVRQRAIVCVCLPNAAPTYNRPERPFWTKCFPDGGFEHTEPRTSPKDPTILPRDNKSSSECPSLPQPGHQCASRNPEVPQSLVVSLAENTCRRGKRPVVEHKGIVGRGGAFLRATSAVSVASVVGQIPSRVRPMFDAELMRRKMSKKAFLSPYL